LTQTRAAQDFAVDFSCCGRWRSIHFSIVRAVESRFYRMGSLCAGAADEGVFHPSGEKTSHLQIMQNMRTYGKGPCTVAVIHGGPGAAGEMAPIARHLAADHGVLEPIQTATTLEGQVQELKNVLEDHSHPPVVLIGFSWGAWLSFIVATRYPAFIKKLVLIGCGPFEEKYVSALHMTRLSRLNLNEKIEFEAILHALSHAETGDKDRWLQRMRILTAKTDAYDALIDPIDAEDLMNLQGDIFHSVWNATAEMRRSGELIGLAAHIRCPVVAIHGDHDPHPANGVEAPLSKSLKDFRFILLEKCGHKPWIERQACERFYRVLEMELQ